MRNLYNISYSRVALLLLPFVLRKEILLSFLVAFVRPLENIKSDFGAYRDLVDTSVNSQICYMRGMLNDHFDFFQRRIIVRTAYVSWDSFLLWQDQYDKPTMIFNEDSPQTFLPSLLNRDGQLGSDNVSFEVVLPVGFILSDDERNRMNALVNNHKLASKTFSNCLKIEI